MSSETVVGVLTRISAPLNGIEYFFEMENDEFRKIKSVRADKVPVNTKIALCMIEIGIGTYEVCEQEPAYTILRENQ